MIWFAYISTIIFFVLLAQYPIQKLLIATNKGLKHKNLIAEKMRPLGFFHINAKLEAASLLLYELCFPLIAFSFIYQIMPNTTAALTGTFFVVMSYHGYLKKQLNLAPLSLILGYSLAIDVNTTAVCLTLFILCYASSKGSSLSLACYLIALPIFTLILNSNYWLSLFSLAISMFYLYSYRIPLLKLAEKEDNPWSLRGWI